MNDDDDNGRLGMWIGVGTGIFIALATVLTLVWNPSDAGSTNAARSTAAAAPVDLDATIDAPLTGDLLGKVYFDSGKADIGIEGGATVDAALAKTSGNARKVMLSGFHDLTGSAAQNAELAKNRSKSVREALKARGLAADRIVLRKPAETGADGPAQEARRVEIRLLD